MSKARVDSGLLGEIIELNNALYPVGKTVEGLLGWQTHADKQWAGEPDAHPWRPIKMNLTPVYMAVIQKPISTELLREKSKCISHIAYI